MAGDRLTSTRSSCLAADSDSMPGSAAAIFLNSACARKGGCGRLKTREMRENKVVKAHSFDLNWEVQQHSQ